MPERRGSTNECDARHPPTRLDRRPRLYERTGPRAPIRATSPCPARPSRLGIVPFRVRPDRERSRTNKRRATLSALCAAVTAASPASGATALRCLRSTLGPCAQKHFCARCLTTARKVENQQAPCSAYRALRAKQYIFILRRRGARGRRSFAFHRIRRWIQVFAGARRSNSASCGRAMLCMPCLAADV